MHPAPHVSVAGAYFTDDAGAKASQGYLKVGLQSTQDRRHLIVVTTHLKV